MTESPSKMVGRIQKVSEVQVKGPSSLCRRLMSVNVGGSKIEVLDMGHEFFYCTQRSPKGNEYHYCKFMFL